jgi:hypothetical protein
LPRIFSGRDKGREKPVGSLSRGARGGVVSTSANRTTTAASASCQVRHRPPPAPATPGAPARDRFTTTRFDTLSPHRLLLDNHLRDPSRALSTRVDSLICDYFG